MTSTSPDSNAITVIANGDPVRLTSEATVADLVLTLELAGRRFALERNGQIVPRSQHPQARLEDGDRIEIVHAVGGG